MDDGDAVKNWVWSALGGSFLLGLLWVAFFLTKPETISLYRSASIGAAVTVPDSRLNLESFDIRLDAPAQVRSAALASAAASSRPAAAPIERLAAPWEQAAAARSGAELRTGGATAAAPARSQAAVQAPARAAAPQERERREASVRYGQAPRSRMMGRALGPVRNFAAGGAVVEPAAASRKDALSFRVESAKDLAGMQKDVEQLRRAAEGKAGMSETHALKILGEITQNVDRARGLK